MAVDKRELIKFNNFSKGVHNVALENSLPPDALRTALNVDIDDAGKMRRRKGYSLVVPTAGLHSLYQPVENTTIGVDATGLVSIDTTIQKTTLTALSRVDLPMYFDRTDNDIFYSNGTDIGRVSIEGDEAFSISAPQPAGQPNATVAVGIGGLNGGLYQVAITFLDASGRESGSTLALEIDAPEGSGIRLTDWPEMTGVAYVNIYMTSENGDVLYLADTIAPTTAPYLLGRRTLGRVLDKQFLHPMPAGIHVCVHNGRLFTAKNNVKSWSESLTYGLTKPSTNWATYGKDKITLIASSGSADSAIMYIASNERTYRIVGADPKDWKRAIVHPYGAVPGSLTYVQPDVIGVEQDTRVPVWQDTAGSLIAGLATGVILQLHKDVYAANIDAEQGCTALVYRDGIQQILATALGGTGNGIRAIDSVEATVYANGVRVS